MTILDERPLSTDERRAVADEPRPGVWLEGSGVATHGDGRALTQHETDQLIGAELARVFEGTPESTEARRILGHAPLPMLADMQYPRGQRGGVHSDQLVRLVAFRVWGARDRAWRKRETSRTLENIGSSNRIDAYRIAYGFDKITLTGSPPGVVACEVWRGEVTARVERTFPAANPERVRAYYFELLDELYERLSRPSQALPAPPAPSSSMASPAVRQLRKQ